MQETSGLALVGGEFTTTDATSQGAKERLLGLAQQLLPVFGVNWHRQLLSLLKVESTARLLYLDMLYRQIIDVPGVICEFGVHFGATMVQLVNLRSIHEPFNRTRTVVGFDTFEGFPELSCQDGTAGAGIGSYATPPGYETVLAELLALHESQSPYAHIRKFDLVKGDAAATAPRWLDEHPAALIAMAVFDMDLYRPTRDVLDAIRPRLTRGSLLVFDELGEEAFPGETVAVREVLGLDALRLRRTPMQPACAWAVVGE